MLVVLIVVAAAIVVGAIAVALGRGGEMAQFTADFAPVDLGAIDEVTATDVALLRLPRALWGYHPQVTDQALGLIAQAISARDVEIAMLQRRLAEVHPAEGAGRQEQFPRPQRPLPPPVADVTGAAAAGPPLPSRPSVRRREMTDQPAMEQPSAGSWPLQAPRSAWQTRSAAASGAPEAGRAPDAGRASDAGRAPETGVPDAGATPDAGPPLAFAPPHDQAPAAGSDPGSAPAAGSDPGSAPAAGSDPGSAPAADPASPAPGADPASPAPAADPASPAPAADPVSPAPDSDSAVPREGG